MKKLIALLTALILLLSLGTVAYGAGSPEGKKEHKIEYTHNIDGLEENYVIIEDGEQITLIRNDYPGFSFLKWEITGEYDIISGDLDSDELVIRPLGDLVIKSLYEEVEDEKENLGGEDKKEEEEQKGETNDSDTSPQTGNNPLPLFAGIFLLSAAAAVTFKKLAK